VGRSDMTTAASVTLWGRTIGAVSLVEGRDYAAFEYDPKFVKSRIEVSPITMPLGDGVHIFPELSRKTFCGLPGLLADALPDTRTPVLYMNSNNAYTILLCVQKCFRSTAQQILIFFFHAV
jgi:hypothetical protein